MVLLRQKHYLQWLAGWLPNRYFVLGSCNILCGLECKRRLHTDNCSVVLPACLPCTANIGCGCCMWTHVCHISCFSVRSLYVNPISLFCMLTLAGLEHFQLRTYVSFLGAVHCQHAIAHPSAFQCPAHWLESLPCIGVSVCNKCASSACCTLTCLQTHTPCNAPLSFLCFYPPIVGVHVEPTLPQSANNTPSSCLAAQCL